MVAGDGADGWATSRGHQQGSTFARPCPSLGRLGEVVGTHLASHRPWSGTSNEEEEEKRRV